MAFVHETDARVVADVIAIASRVEGWVMAVPIEEGQLIPAGAPIAQIDSRLVDLKVAELAAEAAAISAERNQIAARKQMHDQRTASQSRSETAHLESAKALVESLELEFKFAEEEYQRAQALSRSAVVSKQELDRTRKEYQRARQELLRARAEAAAAQAKLEAVQAERGELLVLDREMQVLREREKQYQARLEQARVERDDHTVKSPTAGVISRTFIVPGDYLREGQRVALLHEPRNIWIEANIRETEISRIRVGQRVRISIDAYQDLPVEGRVQRIGQATTAQFALLPNPNPSGNFTKVTQRIPVRIAVDQITPDNDRSGSDNLPEFLLRPGMLVEIDIDTTS